jgi:hypothetical protein
MSSANYDVKCMACSAEIGQILFGKFEPKPDSRASAPRKGGLPRCSHCGGSLYLEPTDDYPVAAARAELLRTIAADAVRRPRAS